ncbi:MAG: hypothetical protein JXB32_01735 [Deltaproteobacteria bacterium]|nr:hypothetical protein [Deltaproteobacteria bacterium]
MSRGSSSTQFVPAAEGRPAVRRAPVPRHADGRRAGAALCLLLAAGACGGPAGPPPLEPTRPWDPSLVDLFDDAADWVSPLRSILGTPWFEEYAAHLERRLVEADVVAVVQLKTIVPAPASLASGALEVEVVRPLLGNAFAGMLLRLDVPPAAAARVEADRGRLEEQGRFVAYVRLVRGELQEVRNHWHLSPADADLVNTIRRTTMP